MSGSGKKGARSLGGGGQTRFAGATGCPHTAVSGTPKTLSVPCRTETRKEKRAACAASVCGVCPGERTTFAPEFCYPRIERTPIQAVVEYLLAHTMGQEHPSTRCTSFLRARRTARTHRPTHMLHLGGNLERSYTQTELGLSEPVAARASLHVVKLPPPTLPIVNFRTEPWRQPQERR